jgi:hypothetical protein
LAKKESKENQLPETFKLKNNSEDSSVQIKIQNDEEDVDEDESDPDINFEVRSEKLNLSTFNSAGHSSDELHCIYQTNNKPAETNALALTNDPSSSLSMDKTLENMQGISH